MCVSGMCLDIRQETQEYVKALIEQITVALEMGLPEELDYQVLYGGIGLSSIVWKNAKYLIIIFTSNQDSSYVRALDSHVTVFGFKSRPAIS